jgi:hypothetical protein
MTAKPYPHAVQKAARRGVLSAAGSKRVEVVLDAEAIDSLETVKLYTEADDNASAIRVALELAALGLRADVAAAEAYKPG